MARLQWALETGRYRDTATGRFVSEQAVRAAMDDLVAAGVQRLQGLTEQMASGQLAMPAYQREFRAALRDMHIATGTLAKGGRAQMNQADYGWLGQRLRTQYQFAEALFQQIGDGRQPLTGVLRTRVGLYAAASRQTYGEMQRRDRRQAGATEERRRLTSGESCAGCQAAADRGWQPLGTLAPLGSQECRANCKCTWETRPARAEAA
jgi:hypothetical protein